MLDWLLRDWTFFGMTGQIWMPVIGAALLVYAVILTLVRRRNTRTH